MLEFKSKRDKLTANSYANSRMYFDKLEEQNQITDVFFYRNSQENTCA